MTSPTKVLFIGQTLDVSGYAVHARRNVDALLCHGYDVQVRPFKCDAYTYQQADYEKRLEEFRHLDFDIVFEHATPEMYGRFIPTGASWKKRVGYFAWETDKIVWKPWIKALNSMDAVLVPCDANYMALKRSGVTVPIHIVGMHVDTSKFDKKWPIYRPTIDDPRTKFYSIFQWSHKKGPELLIKMFTAAFASNPDKAVLYLRTYLDPFKTTPDEEAVLLRRIKDISNEVSCPAKPEIKLVSEYLTEEQLNGFHQSMDFFVLPTRGEGWGIPIFDAAGFGKCPIVPLAGGQSMFLDRNCAIPIMHDMVPCNGMGKPNTYTAFEHWVEPRMSSLRDKLIEAHDMRESGSHWLRDMSTAGRGAVGAFDISKSNIASALNEVLSS